MEMKRKQNEKIDHNGNCDRSREVIHLHLTKKSLHEQQAAVNNQFWLLMDETILETGVDGRELLSAAEALFRVNDSKKAFDLLHECRKLKVFRPPHNWNALCRYKRGTKFVRPDPAVLAAFYHELDTLKAYDILQEDLKKQREETIILAAAAKKGGLS